MGIIETPKTPQVTSPANKRKSGTIDFGSLKPLNAAAGTKNFGGYRDKSPKTKQTTEQGMDSDAEEEDDNTTTTGDVDDEKDNSGKGFLSPEDVYRQGELADGVRKIKVPQTPYSCITHANNHVAKTSTFRRTDGPPFSISRCRRLSISPVRNTWPRPFITGRGLLRHYRESFHPTEEREFHCLPLQEASSLPSRLR